MSHGKKNKDVTNIYFPTAKHYLPANSILTERISSSGGGGGGGGIFVVHTKTNS